jgi:hypothetical protein
VTSAAERSSLKKKRKKPQPTLLTGGTWLAPNICVSKTKGAARVWLVEKSAGLIKSAKARIPMSRRVIKDGLRSPL